MAKEQFTKGTKWDAKIPFLIAAFERGGATVSAIAKEVGIPEGTAGIYFRRWKHLKKTAPEVIQEIMSPQQAKQEIAEFQRNFGETYTGEIEDEDVEDSKEFEDIKEYGGKALNGLKRLDLKMQKQAMKILSKLDAKLDNPNLDIMDLKSATIINTAIRDAYFTPKNPTINILNGGQTNNSTFVQNLLKQEMRDDA